MAWNTPLIDYQSESWQGFSKNIPVLETFFESIHGKRNSISTWRYIDKSGIMPPHNSVYKTLDKVAEIVYSENLERREVFFSIRPFGKIKGNWQQRDARCFVVDLDLGTEDEGIKMAALTKAEEVCEAHKIPYTFLVSSRNGYHFYWSLAERVDYFTWKNGQMLLASLFGDKADKTITNPSQDMRLPATLHWKGNPSPYFVNLTPTAHIYPYSLKDFSKAIGLPNEEDWMCAALTGSYSHIPEILRPKVSEPKTPEMPILDVPVKDVSEVSSNTISKQFKKSLGQTSQRYIEIGEAINSARSKLYLLQEFTGRVENVGTLFCCPYHADKSPSANFIKSNNGNYLFHCFACKFSADIVELIRKFKFLEGWELVKYVLEMSDRKDLIISYSKSVGFGDYLETNKSVFNLLNPPSKFLSNYTKPDRKLIKCLWKFYTLANKKIKNSDRKFPASLTEIQKHLKIKKLQNSSKKIYFFVFMGLVKRLKDDQLPEGQLEINENFCKGKGYSNRTSWWIIPEYDEELLKNAFVKLKQLRENRITLENISEKTILKVFGQEAVDLVFVGQTTWMELIRRKKAVVEAPLEDWQTKNLAQLVEEHNMEFPDRAIAITALRSLDKAA